MQIRLVNPNTTTAMTETVLAAARSVAGPGTRCEAVTPAMGPASIESHYEEALAVPGLLQQVLAGEREGVSGYVIACFGDPGLDAARELAVGPVLGIAEAGMHAAAMVGSRFAVVTTLARTVGRTEELLQRYGFASRCTGVRACEVPVLELDDPASGAAELVAEQCRLAVAEGAEAVLLGCAGMAPLCRALGRRLRVPVVDGVGAATVMVEALLRLGLSTAKTGGYAVPPAKAFSGLLSGFTLDPHPSGSRS